MQEKKVRFVRIKGRVVPIKIRREKVKSSAIKTGAGIGSTALAIHLGSKDLKKSFFSFNKASDFAAMRKLVKRGSEKRGEFIRKSAAFRIGGRKLARTGKFKIDAGIALGSLFIGSAVKDLFDTSSSKEAREASDEIGSIFSTALAIGAIGIVGRKFKIKAKSSSGLMSKLQRKGKGLASKKFEKVSSSGLGVLKKRRESEQLELFENKKSKFINKFLGKKLK